MEYNVREDREARRDIEEDNVYHLLDNKLDQIIKLLERIIDMLERKPRATEVPGNYGKLTEYLDAITLLSLPDHLRRTAIALAKLGGESTAEEVSKETGRARAVESAYLNQLVAMGYVAKKRKGRKVYFYFLQE